MILKILQKPQEIKVKVKKGKVSKHTKKVNVSSKKNCKKPKNKNVYPIKAVSAELVDLCLNALQQVTIHYMKKKSIFDDETPIFAEIHCIKIQDSKGNLKFVLPHSTVASTGEVCLITPDLKKGKKVDHEPTIDHWEEILRKSGVTSVKTVLPMRQLRVEYDQFELKRRLLTQHDFIMVDTRVLSHVSHLLGKIFFKKHNMLIPVRINEKGDIKKDIDIGLRTSILRLSEGQTSTILIGHTGMPQNNVKENILALIQQLRDKYPGGEANIRSISLKLPLSLSLPLYLTLRPSKISVPKLKHNKPRNYVELEDELSTMPGSIVRVAPDGNVHVKKYADDISDMEDDDMKDNEPKEVGGSKAEDSE